MELFPVEHNQKPEYGGGRTYDTLNYMLFLLKLLKTCSVYSVNDVPGKVPWERPPRGFTGVWEGLSKALLPFPGTSLTEYIVL